MRSFNYFLFDNYDTNQIKTLADDPRIVLGEKVDAILSYIIDKTPNNIKYNELCSCFSCELVDSLIHIGLFKVNNSIVLLDCPVIVKEDAKFLSTCFENSVNQMVNEIISKKNDYYKLAQKFDNGFSPKVNLYHILCGVVLDGCFFDLISNNNIVATSKIHPSGLDYLIVVYEKDAQLDELSNKLLCSYNRFTDGRNALQSFGDSNGNRIDFFRFEKQKQLNNVSSELKHIEEIWNAIGDEKIKSFIFEETKKYIENRKCDEKCYALLKAFDYIQNEKLRVPVYRKKHESIIEEIVKLTEQCIFDIVKNTLESNEIFDNLFCRKYDISIKEISNELYHIMFGQINEKLVSKGFVEKPKNNKNEGRYLKSIELGD